MTGKQSNYVGWFGTRPASAPIFQVALGARCRRVLDFQGDYVVREIIPPNGSLFLAITYDWTLKEHVVDPTTPSGNTFDYVFFIFKRGYYEGILCGVCTYICT